MRLATRSLVIGACVLGTGSVLAQNAPWPAPSAAARATYDRFTGIYRLVDIEQRDAGGRTIAAAPPPATKARGYLAYDSSGYMSATIAGPDRARFKAGQPSGDEARAAVDSFTAYFGSFRVDDQAATVTHQTLGALQPQLSGTDLAHRFSLAGNRLLLTSPAATQQAHRTLTWERVPDLPNLTPLHRQIVGFWKLISTERRNTKGDLVRAYPGWTGLIVYTASGHMLVHMAEPYRRRPADDPPTAAESIAAYQSYTSYFGTYTINEDGRSLVHHVEGSVIPSSAGTDTLRYFEVAGKQLILRPPAIKTPDGDVIMTNVWERVLG